MEIKIKHILFAALALTIGIVSFVIIKMKVVKNENFESIDVNAEETTYSEYVYYGPDSYTSWELGYEVAKKNGDWSRLPLTSGFRKKYNERDGILGNLEFDKIELAPYDNITEYSDKYYFVNRNCYFVISRGKEKIAYIYNLKYDGNLLSDVLIKDVCNLSNEYGEELNVSGYAITNNNFKDSMDFLARGGNDEKSVAVTDNFHRKYPYFLDLFIHYSPLGANEITFKSEKSSWEKKEAYFEVDSIYECIKRHYIVNFKIDSRGYLDDAKAKLVGEYPYDEHYESERASSQVFYKNSNWSVLKLSNRFKNKYNNKNSIYIDIDNVNPNEIYVDYCNDKFEDMIIGCKLLNGNNRWFYVDFTYINKDYLDDAEILPIDYDGEDIEEAKKAYIKQYEH